jgi:signal transduction histidine kinase
VRGLRVQILAALALVTVGGIVSVGVLSVWRVRQVLVIERHERAAAQTALAGDIVSGLIQGVQGDAERGARLSLHAGELAAATGASSLALIGPNGPIWPTGAPALDGDGLGASGAMDGMAPHPVGHAPGGGVVLYAPVVDGGRPVAALRAVFDVGDSVDATLLKAQRRVIWLAIANGLILLGAAAWLLRTSVVKPVLELERAAGRVAAGDLGATVAASARGPGELGRLADAFDSMTRSLRDGRESLMRSEKLAGVGRLAAGVAHEVGNPLAAILGYVETLLTETPERPIDAALRADILARVRAETQRIHTIIQELLDYSRPPRDEIGPVEVRGAVDAAVSLVRAQARARGVDVHIELPAELPRVRAATGRLTQVVLNLVLNAVDANDGRGRVRVDGRVAGGRVIIGVSDEGPGVSAELRGKIFDPFFTTKDPGKGTGLGLSVSQSIVESMGGVLRLADAAPGQQGARFEVELDAA